MITSVIQGLLVGFTLIVAIGAQNAFVLRQGLRREHGWLVAGICAGCDLALVAVGVAGLAPLITSSATALQLARWGGVGWLVWQAAIAFRRARRPRRLEMATTANDLSAAAARPVILATLAVTLLNPHVYLDTVVMLGIIGGQQPSPAGFVAGASLASLVWFFGLVGMAHWLSPKLQDPRWWQGIDIAVGAIMLLVAWQLATRTL
ncbi:LysE/ArgO family amino acid transporter [Salinicola acroporae]|uniref:Lysine transporter LysE n=1 Tax=Salinicola acroporae TaxID=1541440 RepID=A0ABT6I5W0_9GAMM|nr:LysE family transporter [Salinicola acroporae]MDH4572804.1 lysine transporter LysE [Salinicola acroporae]